MFNSKTEITDQIAVRTTSDTDREALRLLAQRDTSSVPAGRLLAAEADGALIAAISLDSGAVVADPFRATGQAVELLKLRAAQVNGAEPKQRRRIRIPSLPRASGALAGSPPGGGSRLLQL